MTPDAMRLGICHVIQTPQQEKNALRSDSNGLWLDDGQSPLAESCLHSSHHKLATRRIETGAVPFPAAASGGRLAQMSLIEKSPNSDSHEADDG